MAPLDSPGLVGYRPVEMRRALSLGRHTDEALPTHELEALVDDLVSETRLLLSGVELQVLERGTRQAAVARDHGRERDGVFVAGRFEPFDHVRPRMKTA